MYVRGRNAALISTGCRHDICGEEVHQEAKLGSLLTTSTATLAVGTGEQIVAERESTLLNDLGIGRREPYGRPVGTSVPSTRLCRRTKVVHRAAVQTAEGIRVARRESDIGQGELRRRPFGTSVPYTCLSRGTAIVRWSTVHSVRLVTCPVTRVRGRLTSFWITGVTGLRVRWL